MFALFCGCVHQWCDFMSTFPLVIRRRTAAYTVSTHWPIASAMGSGHLTTAGYSLLVKEINEQFMLPVMLELNRQAHVPEALSQ